MTELLTAAQMRAIEQAAIESGEVTGLELMERAGRGVVGAILEEWPTMALTSHKAVVLCGPGNNGGDGFVVARLLKLRGWEVSVFLLGNEAKLPVDAATNCQRWMELGKIKGLAEVPEFEQDYDLYIDALFGTGLTRGLDKEPLRIISGRRASPYHQERWLAVDIPSGLCADSGRVIAGHDLPRAAITVTFHTEKLGHRLADGPDVCGKVISKDIGLDGTRKIDAVQLVDMDYELGIWPLQKQSGGNKYSLGHALILSGGAGKGGAGRLAARGALRIGAGLVTVACPPEALAENAAQLNAIMLNPIADGVALEEVLKDERINALCLGPALGLDQHTRDLVEVALKSGRKVVLDADALTVFKGDPDTLFGMLHENVVLTPHGGEFWRLFPDIAAKLAELQLKAQPIPRLMPRGKRPSGLGALCFIRAQIRLLRTRRAGRRLTRRIMNVRPLGWRRRGLAMCWRGLSRG